MEFTGERYVPDLKSAQISYEHLHRYFYASHFTNGKKVLDIACGEGYGSFYLAENAKEVIGVDIDSETIKYATKRYKKNNLSFILGSADSIPIDENGIFDVVVSFETIEHISEESQFLFLKEVKRLLKKDGILIISTPSKESYSDIPNYKNEFHIKEFYINEFDIFLKKYFNNVNILGQKIYNTSLIWPGNNNSKSCIDFTIEMRDEKFVRSNRRKDILYMIALCSENDLADYPSSFLVDITEQLKQEQWDITNQFLYAKDAVIKDNENVIQEKENVILEKENVILEKENVILEKENVILEKENVIQEKENVIQEKENVIQEKENVIQEKENVIQEKEKLVTKQTNSILAIYNSFSWKFTQPLRWLYSQLIKLFYIFCPYGTKRWFIMKTILRFILHPIKMIRRISFFRLMILFKALKEENLISTDKNLANKVNYINPLTTSLDFLNFTTTDISKGIVVPEFLNPEIVFIIAFNQDSKNLYFCIQSILRNASFPFKLILLKSEDFSSQDIQFLTGPVEFYHISELFNVLSNIHSLKHVILLDHSSNIQKNTIQHCLDTFGYKDSVAMVIPKIIINDLTLDSAGIIIWNDGSTTPYGRGMDPLLPEFEYVKEVDSGNHFALISLADFLCWSQRNESATNFWPFILHDISMFLRSNNKKVLFQPLSLVVVQSGHQPNNIEKKPYIDLFKEKWNSSLSQYHYEKNESDIFLARERGQGKKYLLMIDHDVPHFDKDAGSKTMKDFIDLYHQCNVTIKFIGDNFFNHQPYTEILQQKSVEVLFGPYYAANWKKWIKNHGKYFSYIFLSRPHIAIKYINLCRDFTSAKIIYYGHDLHYLRELRQFDVTQDKTLIKSIEKNKKKEQTIFKHADIIYYPSDIEIQRIKQDFKIAKTFRTIVPYIFHNFPEFEYDPKKRNNIMFVGGFNHLPNVDGILWFLEKIYPIVLNAFPDLHFYIIGSYPPEEIRCKSTKNVTITGFVSEDELKLYYRSCRIVVAPLRYGSGIKGKIIEAFYNCVPVITTSIGAEGIQEKDNILLIADKEDAFANLIINSYNNLELLENIAERAYTFLKTYYSKEKALSIIKQDL
jgi:ubiquinone/menaquinone biosynthesis C-methylase UbiE